MHQGLKAIAANSARIVLVVGVEQMTATPGPEIGKNLLKASDVFCLPSRSEGLSNALLEAMACRLPCVATDVGGNPEAVIDGLTGFLVPAENPEALAARILTLLRNRDSAQRMGQASRRLVESKFTVQHMIHRLAFLYNELLRERGLLSRTSA